MVFESLVADLVNRFLGDFVENLDKSQLSLGIWGGDVVLNNLYVKENLLDELDLPIRVLYGNIGQLKLKIPWKNLYTEPTIALLDGLYIIAVPNSSIVYDDAKEQKNAWDTKQKELARIEEAKKREAEKDQTKDPKQDTFVEKLVTNVIKNLEVKVTNIHVRYEDSYTNPAKPFSIGVTLRELSCQTTDVNWKITIIKEAASIIYKLLKLDSLSLYWNISATRYLGRDRVSLQSMLKQNIVADAKGTDYQYMIEPMTSNARLRMHTKPEQDSFSLPKILLNVVFEEIAVALRKTQFHVLMEFLASFERMQLASKYRKYHPNVPRKGNYKTWWHFAYTCILEETVRRRRKMWSWSNISRHRTLCKEYRGLYKTKLLTSKPPSDLLAKIEKCEKELDVMNITLMRQQADLEVKRHHAQRKAKKEGAKKPNGSGGWFGGWLSWGSKPAATSEEKSVSDKVQELMTPEEKQKLYDAIGYQENVDTVFPKEYVATQLQVSLTNLRLKLVDTDAGKDEVLQLQLQGVGADVEQRPGASAVKVKASMKSMVATGLASDDKTPVVPTLISSLTKQQEAFFDVLFETNPLDGACDTKIDVSARPLEVIYAAQTIISLADFFKPPEEVQVLQLQAAALAKFEEVKQQTTTGFQYALQQQKYTEITVHLQPTHIIIPEKGVNEAQCRMLVLDMGKLSVSTEKPAFRSSQSLSAGDASPKPKLSLDEMKQQAYDRFTLSLDSFQLLFVGPGEDWTKARDPSVATDMHILRPMSLNVNFYKVIIPDIELPKMRIVGDLPTLSVSLSDQKLLDILSLANSIPLPQGAPSAPEEETDVTLNVPDLKNLPIKEETDELVAKFQHGEGDSPGETRKELQRQTSTIYNETDLELRFEIKEICLNVSQRKNNVDVPTIKVVIESVGTEVRVRTYDTSVTAFLGGIYLQHTHFKAVSDGPLVNLINTPIIDEQAFKLLTVQVLLAQRKHPDFATIYENTLQKISINFSALELLLHQEAILNIMEFGQSIQQRMEKPKEEERTLSRAISRSSISSVSSAMKKLESRRSRRRKEEVVEVIEVAINAQLDILSIAICNQERILTDVKIKGLESRVTLQKSRTCVAASLKDITVFDHVPQAIYPKILSFDGGEVFKADITLFNNATKGSNYSDMQCVDTKVVLNTGCMKVIFLNKFVQDLLNFLNQFQMAKDKISEASSAVKDVAATAAQDLSQKATRISLDIKMKAPIVVIPKNSKSNDALVVDLGKLNVSNTFQVLGKKDGQGLPAILDCMVVELTSLRIFRALVMETEVRAECLILEPVTLKVEIIRNLAASWYHGHPDVEIQATLQSFSILTSQGDLSTTFGILNGNLQEGSSVATPPPTSPVPSPSPAKAVSPRAPSSSQPTLSVPGTRPAVAPSPAADDIYSNMKACFTLESVALELFTGDSDLSVGICQRDGSRSLAKVELKTIRVLANMKSDKSIEATVDLSAIQLHDSRPTKQSGITLMISPSKKGTGMIEPENMIALKFIQDSLMNKDVDMKVNGLYVVVCVEFLLKVSNLFLEALPKMETPPTPAPSSPGSPKSEKTSPPGPATPPSSPTTDESQAEMKIRFALNRPEIVLVEDAMDLNTNSLFLGLQINFLMRSTPSLETMKAAIKGLNIVSTTYSAAPDATRAPILSPLDIELQSSAPYRRNHHMALNLSDVFLTISSDSIRIITAALASLSVPKEEEEGQELNKIPKDLWAVKKIEDEQYWFLKSMDMLEEGNLLRPGEEGGG